MDLEAWTDDLEAERRAYDARLAGSEGSPLPADRRAGFQGLSYYPPDPRYDVRGVLHADGAGDVTLVDTLGVEEAFRRAGRVRLILPEGAFVLAAFRPLAERAGRLFLPFTDRTTGRETHRYGRFVEPVLLEGDRVRVDLNRARHPVSVHNAAYASALPPSENDLPFALRVGERLRPQDARLGRGPVVSSASPRRPGARPGARLAR